MHTKAGIFNLSLGLLLLSRQITNPDTDKSNEAKVLITHWDVALAATLEDLDLDGTSTQKTLELIEEDPNDLWSYSYQYPSDCVFLRRIQSLVDIDNRKTQIRRRVTIKDGKKCIFTNEIDAVIEYISKDVPIASLSATAGLAVATRLAILSAPLVTGKGSKSLKDSLEKAYIITKAEAQDHDRRENMNFEDPTTESDWVDERMS